MAGIMVGEEFWMANEDIKVPPIVILSACSGFILYSVELLLN